MRSGTKWRASGFSIVEAIIAAAVILVGLSALFAASGQSMELLKQARFSASASQIAQQRMEMLRRTGAANLLSATAVQTLMATKPDSELEMQATSNLAETLQITPYPSGSPIVINATRSGGSISTASTGATSLSGTHRGYRVDLQISWNDRMHAGTNKQVQKFAMYFGRYGIAPGTITSSTYAPAGSALTFTSY